MLLRNKVAIVTGGTRGIGEAIVKKFVQEGARVIFIFNQNYKLAAKIKKQTRGRALGFQVDIRDMDAVKEFIKLIRKRFKRLDILVNNAGIVRDRPLMLMDKEKDWDDVIATNLTGAFNLTRACIVTFMKQKSGSIINISSLSGLLGVPGQANYAASKAGLIGFTRALSREVGGYNVRVNSIVPGFIQTEVADKFITKSTKEKIVSQVSLRRLGTPDEVAELALFLASDRSAYITGQSLIIDGGLA